MLEVPSAGLVEVSTASDEAVRLHLRRVLVSRQFAESERLSGFLKFSVESALAGQSDRLKEAVIAVEVFGRETSFDGNSDSIVRNAARRLRTKLAEYYQNEGRHEALRIEMPKGRYVPVFHSAGESQRNIEVQAASLDGEAEIQPQPYGSQQHSGKVLRWLIAATCLGALAICVWLLSPVRRSVLGNRSPAALQSGRAAKNPISAHLYSEAVDRLQAFDPSSAAALLEKAVAIEPSSPLLHFKLSRAYQALGYWTKARSEAEAAFRLRARLNHEEQAETAAWLSEVSFDFTQAVSAYSKLAAEFPDNHDYAVRLAYVLSRTGKLDASVSVLDRAIQVNRGPAADLVLEKAQILGLRSDYAQALECAREAAAIAVRAGLRPFYAQALLLERGLLLDLGRTQPSDEARQQAAAVCQELRDRGCIVHLLRVDGNEALIFGHLAKAEKSYAEGLRIAREMGNRLEQNNLLDGIALLQIREKHLEQAGQTYEAAWRISDGAPTTRASIDLDRAYLALLLADLASAARLYEQALSEAQSIGEKEYQAIALEGLGDVDAIEGRLTAALRSYDRSASTFKEQGLAEGFARLAGKKAGVIVSTGQPEDAARQEQVAASLDAEHWRLSPDAHLAVAQRLLAQHKGDQAAAEARTAGNLFEQQVRDVDGQTAASIILLHALMQRHLTREAVGERARLDLLCTRTANQVVLLEARVASAESLLDQKFEPSVAGRLAEMAREAESHGMLMCSLEAKLALARAAIQNRVAGRPLVDSLEQQARRSGAVLLARQAGELALESRPKR